MKKDSRIVRRNRRFLYRMLSAGGRVATKDDNTLRHVTAIGRVHFYKQLVDDDAFGDSQPTQKTYRTPATIRVHQIILQS